MTTKFSSMNRSNISTNFNKNQKQNLPQRLDFLSQTLQKMEKQIVCLIQQQQSIKEAKINVQRYLDQKSQQNKQRLLGELKNYQDQVKKKIQNTRSQTKKIDQKIQILKNGQLEALQLILGIQRRVQQLQIQLGMHSQL